MKLLLAVKSMGEKEFLKAIRLLKMMRDLNLALLS